MAVNGRLVKIGNEYTSETATCVMMYATKRNPTRVNGSPRSFERNAWDRICTPGRVDFGASPIRPLASLNRDLNVRRDPRLPGRREDDHQRVRPARRDDVVESRARGSLGGQGWKTGAGRVLEPPSGRQLPPNDVAGALPAQVGSRGRRA